MSRAQSPSRFAVILAFGLVYLFWGSTYLAIDIAVQTIPPALMCGVRFSIAGVVMLVVCAATGRRIWYSARQIALASVVGILLLMGGTFGAVGAGGFDHRHHAVMVSGAGFAAAGAPSYFVAGESRAGAGNGGAPGFVLA
jgi:drug/metabolite transporter (DMT)-like permease